MRRRRDEHCWEAALDNDLTGAQAEHLAGCTECRRKVEAVRGVAGGARAAAPPMAPELDARVLVAVAHDAATRTPPATAPRRGRPRVLLHGGVATGLAVAATAAAVVLALRPAVSGDEARAVPIVPLTAYCGTGTAGASSGAGRRLIVAGTWSGPEAKQFARVLARFEDRTGVRLTYAYESRNIAATLRARIKRGCAPDVALLPQPGLLDSLARRGQIQPLDAATRATVARNYGAGWRQLATVGGRQYGVWFKAADKSLIWYRRDALRAARIDAPPRTWDELLADARQLASHGVAPLAIAGASPWTLTDWFENLYLRSAGPVPYQRLARHRIPWTDPSVRRVLHQLGGLLGDRQLVPPPAQTLETSFEESVGQVFGPRPSAAMVYEGDFVRSFLPRAAAPGDRRSRAAVRTDASFFEFPTITGGRSGAAVVGGDVAVAFNASATAQRLLRFLATPAAAEAWASAGGFVSPNRAVRPRSYPDALTRRAAAALARASTVRFDLSDLQPPAFGATAEQGMWGIFQDFLADPANVDGTARRLEAAAKAAWACERAISGSC
jgi:ABC-type glycerol-3-phosphate transport system substrate-binding protein